MTQVDVPVLVVGGGPVGLLTSLLLAKQGVESRVLERRAGLHAAPQAHVIGPRSLEICRSAGLDVDSIYAQATPVADSTNVLWLTTLAGAEVGRLSFGGGAARMLAATPTPFANLSQHLFEPILLEALRRRGRDVRFGQQWESLEVDDEGVTSRVRDLESDRVHEIRSRTLIAADGAGSRIRSALDIDMIGPQRIASFAMIYFEANLRPLLKERPALLYWLLDAESRGTFIAHQIDHTWVYMYPLATDTETDEISEDRARAIVLAAIGTDEVDLVVRDVSAWTMTAQIAERYQSGRVFLVGDAAHRFPPTGGIGMNTGIGDAHNLAWKLGATEAGWAGPGLLSSYEAERRPVAQTNSDQSVRNAMRMLEIPAALGLPPENEADWNAHLDTALANADVRARVAEAIEGQRDHFDMLNLHIGYVYAHGALVADDTAPLTDDVNDYVPTTRPGARLPHTWLVRDGGFVSTLDLIAPDGFTLLVGEGEAGDEWQAAADGLSGPRVHSVRVGRDVDDPDGAWAAMREVGPDGAILVRPDQHVAWRAATAVDEPRKALARALETTLRGAA